MIKLSTIATTPSEDLSKKAIKKEMEDLLDQLEDLQYLLNAEGERSLLVVLQGMDASGKDGITKKVFGACMPSGISVTSFKKPTEEEFAHDFLWRIHKEAPRKGMIKIFNRSHYEDVLIQRVHKWIDEEKVDKRIAAINAFEELLAFDGNTTILKFYLHLSKDQQAIELQQRIDESQKNWKHNDGDWKEREHWEEYMRCYEDVINRCTTPWHVIPMDERWYGQYLIAQKTVETLQSLNMEFPPLETEKS